MFDEHPHRTRARPRGATALALLSLLMLCTVSPAFAQTTTGTPQAAATVQETMKLDGGAATESAHAGRYGASTGHPVNSTDLYRVGFG